MFGPPDYYAGPTGTISQERDRPARRLGRLSSLTAGMVCSMPDDARPAMMCG
jgi:hypothetical protein